MRKAKKTALHGVFVLPEGYALLREVDLLKDKKLAIGVNLAALLIAAAMVPVGLWFSPIAFTPGEIILPILPLLAVVVGMIGYLFAHELIHGFFIRRYCGKPAQYGFKVLYAYAGRDDAYFAKGAYIVIALAPVVFLLLCLLLPAGWFWPVYLLQIINVSGAAGDFYVTLLLLGMKKRVYINDDGVSMRFYGER